MTPTSRAQLEAMDAGTVPPVESVRNGIWAVAVPMPGGQRYLGYSLCYLLRDEDGRVHVVDPGWDSPENRALLDRAIRDAVDDVAVASVIVTHLHQDHIGLAEHLRRETGAPIVLHEREDRAIGAMAGDAPAALPHWGVPEAALEEFAALRELTASVPRAPHGDLLLRGDVDRLDVRGWDIDVIRTPGHTPGSVCLRIRDAGVILTGDTVLPVIHPGLGLGGTTDSNPIADYLDSLDRLAADDGLEVLPGHGYRFSGLRERRAGLAEHHLRRTREVASALEAMPGASVWEIAATLTWTAGWANMHGFFLYSALSQTALHIDYLSRRALVPSAADRLEGRA